MSTFDDYLNAAPAGAAKPSFDSYLGAAPPVPASAAGGAGAAAVPTAAGQPAPLGGFLTGVGDVAKGTTQGIVHGLSWLADKVAPNSQFAQDARGALPQMDQDIAQQNAAYEAQRAANGGSGIDLARLAGNALGTAPTLMMGGGTSLPARMAIGALQGGAGAAMLPTTNPDQSFADQKLQQIGVGGALGAAVPGAFGAAKAIGSNLYNAARPILNPAGYVGQQFASQIGDQAGNVANSIRSAPQYVPGSLPTTAQAAPNATLVATEKAAANSLPGFKIALAEREAGNNQARWDQLSGIAGTDLDLQNAIAARSTATTPLYNIAKQQPIPVDAPMTDLMSRPAMQTAIDRAQKLASNTNAGPIFQTTRIPNSMGGSATTSQTLTGNGAQAVKESLDAMLLPENTQKLSGKEIGALQDTRSAYISWLEGHSPAFTQARQTYAGMSPPINTMQAAQDMQARLGGLGRSLNTSGTPQITAPGYATALGQALKNQEFGIDPAAQTALENIGQDLQRSTVSNSLRTGGSDTAYNLAANGWLARNLYGPAFGGATGAGRAIGALGAAATGHPWIGAGILTGGAKAGQMVGNRLNAQLSNYLLDPQALLPYLDARAAAATQAVPNPLVQRLLQYGRPALVNGLSGGLNNANQ